MGTCEKFIDVDVDSFIYDLGTAKTSEGTFFIILM